MGYLELLLKVIEAVMTVLVVLSLALMKVCPWRKENLAMHLKDGSSSTVPNSNSAR
jgi:hypothetical protein